jgi:mitochondrial import inner membrane translocase subunit TIM22
MGARGATLGGGLVAGGALGVAGGIVFGSLDAMNPSVAERAGRNLDVSMKEALRETYSVMRNRSVTWGKNFAIFGGVYSALECTVEQFRGKHDLRNTIIAGCGTGAALAYNQGPFGIITGCVGVATFSVIIEQIFPR